MLRGPPLSWVLIDEALLPGAQEEPPRVLRPQGTGQRQPHTRGARGWRLVCAMVGLGLPVWGRDLDKVGRWAGLCPLMGSGKQVVCIALTCSLSWSGKPGHGPVVTRGRGPRGQLASPGGSDGLSTTWGGEVGGASTPWGN